MYDVDDHVINSGKFMVYRLPVYRLLLTWETKLLSSDVSEFLAKLLGYDDMRYMFKYFNEEDIKTCLNLAGPHGYAIYRALLVKRGIA